MNQNSIHSLFSLSFLYHIRGMNCFHEKCVDVFLFLIGNDSEHNINHFLQQITHSLYFFISIQLTVNSSDEILAIYRSLQKRGDPTAPLHHYYLNDSSSSENNNMKRRRGALVNITHPDDENERIMIDNSGRRILEYRAVLSNGSHELVMIGTPEEINHFLQENINPFFPPLHDSFRIPYNHDHRDLFDLYNNESRDSSERTFLGKNRK